MNAPLPFLEFDLLGANLQHSWHFMIGCPYFIKEAFLFLLLHLPFSEMELRASERAPRLQCTNRPREGGAETTEPVTDLDCLSIRLPKMEHGARRER